jgi:preprotein translocase subunit SecG
MHAVVQVIQIFIAVGLVAVILLQRSEGGALGMGGGPGGLMSGRAAGNVLTRTTTILAAAFFVTCIALSALAQTHKGASVLETIDKTQQSAPAAATTPAAPGGAPGAKPGAGAPAKPTPAPTPAPTVPAAPQ